MSERSSHLTRRALVASVAIAALAACSRRVGRTASDPTATSDATPTAAASRTAAVPRATASATHAPTPSPRHTGPAGPDIHSGPSTRRAVALTFHGAGDPALARQVLREFAAANAHGTILAVGNWLDATPSLASAILDGGHDLGNHTWSHQVMPTLGAQAADIEVARCAALLRKLTGSEGTWFRPSGTPVSTPTIRAAAGRSGYARCLSFDVDPLDYLDPGATAVRDRVLAAARPGSIVSLHLGHVGTVRALPGILDGLRSRHLAAVTASTLLAGTSAAVG